MLSSTPAVLMQLREISLQQHRRRRLCAVGVLLVLMQHLRDRHRENLTASPKRECPRPNAGQRGHIFTASSGRRIIQKVCGNNRQAKYTFFTSRFSNLHDEQSITQPGEFPYGILVLGACRGQPCGVYRLSPPCSMSDCFRAASR